MELMRGAPNVCGNRNPRSLNTKKRCIQYVQTNSNVAKLAFSDFIFLDSELMTVPKGIESYVEFDESLPTGKNLQRIARHLVVSGWSCEEQKELDRLRIAIVGAGGLGSTVAVSLCAASSSQSMRTVIDYDLIELSNLHRQTAYSEKMVGESKAECLRKACISRNSTVTVDSMNVRITFLNACSILRDFDVVFDCTDNLESRLAISEAWIKLGRRQVLISASCVGWCGQVTTFHPGSTACVSCIYSGVPSHQACNQNGQCAIQGVIGPVVGMIANMQMLELMQYIRTRTKRPTRNPVVRLIDMSSLDALHHEYELLPSCQRCTMVGVEDEIRIPEKVEVAEVPEITADEFHKLLISSFESLLIVDVREKNHFRLSRIMGSQNYPASELESESIKIADLTNRLLGSQAQHIVIVCRRGINSSKVLRHLSAELPLRNLVSLRGGLLGLGVEKFV
jgi:molybdopterin/thiamine biosynthesis adenylyltransferase/rhodanese-related sulfurtransferase